MDRKLLSLAAVLLLFIGCGEIQETKQATQAAADQINQVFVSVRTAEQTLVDDIASLYAKIDTLDLSTEKLDTSGSYAMFPGFKYYYKTKPEGSALYLSPGKPLTPDLKRAVRMMEYIDPLLQKGAKATEYQTTTFFGTQDPYTIALLSPPFDIVSMLPPGLTLDAFEWYNRGLNSAGGPVWSAKPFTDLSRGWVMDVSQPVQLEHSRGVTVISVDLEKVSDAYIESQKSALVLVGAHTTVVGISPAAEQLLKISALESVDYLKQMKDNTFAPGKYRLDDESQTAELRSLAEELKKGTTEFSVVLQGTTYRVFKSAIPENDMAVIGFVRP